MKNLTFFMVLLVFIFGCDLPTDVKMPKWDVTFQIPISKQTLKMDEFLDDQEKITAIPVQGSANDSIYSYNDLYELQEKNLAEYMVIDAFDDLTSVEFGDITIEDISDEETDAFEFRELMPTAVISFLEDQLIQHPEGFNYEIEESQLNDVSKNHRFKRFKSVEFASGRMAVTITNNSVIKLDNISIRIIDSVSAQEKMHFTFISEIDPGESATESIPLNNITLNRSIILTLSGHSSGSGQPVLITSETLNSMINVSLSADNLKVRQAEARIPAQTIEKSGIIELPESDFILQSAQPENAQIILNSSPDFYDHPAGTNPIQAGFSFVLDSVVNSENLPLEGFVNGLDGMFAEPLNDYQIRCALENQFISYRYSVFIESSGDDFAFVHRRDQVNVSAEFLPLTGNEIQLQEVTGVVKELEVEIDDVNETVEEFPSEFDDFNFVDVAATALLEYDINFPLTINFDLIAENNNGQTESIHISRALNGEKSFLIDGMEDLINIRPTRIKTQNTSVRVGDNVTEGTISANDKVKVDLNLAIPMEFRVDSNTSLNIEPEEIEKEEDFPTDVQSMSMTAEVDNGFEFGVKLKVIAAKTLNNLEAGINTNTFAEIEIGPKTTDNIQIQLDKTQIDFFQDLFFVKTEAYIIGNGQDGTFRMMATDSLTAKLYGTAVYRIDDESDN